MFLFSACWILVWTLSVETWRCLFCMAGRNVAALLLWPVLCDGAIFEKIISGDWSLLGNPLFVAGTLAGLREGGTLADLGGNWLLELALSWLLSACELVAVPNVASTRLSTRCPLKQNKINMKYITNGLILGFFIQYHLFSWHLMNNLNKTIYFGQCDSGMLSWTNIVI